MEDLAPQFLGGCHDCKQDDSAVCWEDCSSVVSDSVVLVDE